MATGSHKLGGCLSSISSPLHGSGSTHCYEAELYEGGDRQIDCDGASKAFAHSEFYELNDLLEETTLLIRQADVGADHGPVLAIDTRDGSTKSNTHLKCMLTKFRTHVTASTGKAAVSCRIMQEVRSLIKRNMNITLVELGDSVKIELLDNLARDGLQNKEEEDDLEGSLTVLSQKEREFLHIEMGKLRGQKKYSIKCTMKTSLTVGGGSNYTKLEKSHWPSDPMSVNQVKDRLVRMMEIAGGSRYTGGYCTIFSRDENQEWICLDCLKIKD